MNRHRTYAPHATRCSGRALACSVTADTAALRIQFTQGAVCPLFPETDGSIIIINIEKYMRIENLVLVRNIGGTQKLCSFLFSSKSLSSKI